VSAGLDKGSEEYAKKLRRGRTLRSACGLATWLLGAGHCQTFQNSACHRNQKRTIILPVGTAAESADVHRMRVSIEAGRW
jgi:hypothetical protein